MNDPASTIDCLVAKARQLHSLPTVAMEVLKLTDNPQVDVPALKTCIENDPALTTKLLQVVNSSLFGLSREVSDLNQALALLGIKPLKLLVLGFSLPTGLFAGVAGRTLQHYWRHTLTKAVAGREISQTIWHQPGDDPFIAGLLQDLGILLLIQELGEPYVRLLDKVYAGGRDLLAVEVESMGFDHTRLTSRLLDHWGLPESLVEAVCWGEKGIRSLSAEQKGPGPFFGASEKSLPQILHLAELVARLLADGQSDALGQLLAAGRQYHDISEEQLDELGESLEEKVRQLADVLSLQLPDGLDYRDLLVQAHRRLADVAASAAEDLVRSQFPPDAEDLLGDLKALSEAISEVSRRSKSPETELPETELPETELPETELPETSSRVAEPVEPAVAAVPDSAAPVSPGATAARSKHKRSTTTPTSDLLGQLSVAVATCRQSRCSLSLLLVELTDRDQLARTRGPKGFDALRQSLESACRGVDHPCSICLPHGESGFAIILPDCDRQLGVRLGNQLIQSASRLLRDKSRPGHRPVRISVGSATVALPPKNFLVQNLSESTERCLYGSHAAGGGVVKSIEIY